VVEVDVDPVVIGEDDGGLGAVRPGEGRRGREDDGGEGGEEREGADETADPSGPG
jgi:hypothetical protein